MAESTNNLLLISDRETESARWCGSLSQKDWQVTRAATFDDALALDCHNYLGILLVTAEASDPLIPELVSRCGSGEAVLVLPIVDNASGREVLNLMHMGIKDVLIRPFSEEMLLASIERVTMQRDLVRENMEYRTRLETANRVLKESLDILKLDQMAGRQVQHSLLPPSPLRCGQYEIAHKIVPSLYLSGDFVGYHIAFDRYLLLYFADVSGHGASSAFITILLGFLLRRIVQRHVRDNDFNALARAPEGFVEYVNRQILGTGLEKHLSIFAGSIDMNNHFLRYAVGAQMPMPIFVDGQDARFLPGKGKPVGLYEDASWEVEEIALPPRFALVIASDGIFDILPGENLEQKERALLTAASASGMDHGRLCRSLGMDSVNDAPDDISILTVTRG